MIRFSRTIRSCSRSRIRARSTASSRGSIWSGRNPNGDWATASTSSCAAAIRPRLSRGHDPGRPHRHAVADRGPVLSFRRHRGRRTRRTRDARGRRTPAPADPSVRRRRHAAARRDDRDLPGERVRRIRLGWLQRIRPAGDAGRRLVRLRDDPPGPRDRRAGPRPGSARQRVSVCARPAAASLYTRVFRRRSGSRRGSPPRAGAVRAARDAPRLPWRVRELGVGYPSSGHRRDGVFRPVSAHRLIDGLATTEALSGAFSDPAVLQAMIDVEVALARAQARTGVIPRSAADAIADAARIDALDAEAIARDARGTATVVIPFVAALIDRVRATDPASAAYVHWGATSQDVADTALALLLERARSLLAGDHLRLVSALRRLSDIHAGTIMLGRTLMQPATPITFGLKAAVWHSTACNAWAR